MIFDGLVIGVVLILAIKGFLNGVVREVAGLVGIIGGFFLASRYYHPAGEFINKNLIIIPNKSAIDLVGFIGVFLLVWIFCIFLGFLFNRILKISALGFLDKSLGFLVGGLKFFLMVSIIVASLYRVEFLKKYMDKLSKNSVTFPLAVEVGDTIMKLSPEDFSKVQNDIKEKISKNMKNNLKLPENLDTNLLKNVKIPKDLNKSLNNLISK